MDRLTYSVTDLLERGAMEQPPELRRLFHQLNNQLGIILAHAELMEKKAADETSRSRATQVVSSVLDAMGTVGSLKSRLKIERRSPAFQSETERRLSPHPSSSLPVTRTPSCF